MNCLRYFFLDFNLPAADAFGSQSAICLIKQLIDYHHWYDCKTHLIQCNSIEDCQFIGAMNPSKGNKNGNNRLERDFVTFSLPLPTIESIYNIFHSSLQTYFQNQNFQSAVRYIRILLEWMMSFYIYFCFWLFFYSWFYFGFIFIPFSFTFLFSFLFLFLLLFLFLFLLFFYLSR